jgi:hypothetical protein
MQEDEQNNSATALDDTEALRCSSTNAAKRQEVSKNSTWKASPETMGAVGVVSRQAVTVSESQTTSMSNITRSGPVHNEDRLTAEPSLLGSPPKKNSVLSGALPTSSQEALHVSYINDVLEFLSEEDRSEMGLPVG